MIESSAESSCCCCCCCCHVLSSNRSSHKTLSPCWNGAIQSWDVGIVGGVGSGARRNLSFFHNREVQHWHSALSRSSYTNQTEYSVIFWPCVDRFSIALVAQEIRRAWDDVAKNGTIVSGLSYYLFVTNGNFLFKSKWSSRVVESAYAVKVLLEAFCIDIHSLRSNFSHFRKDIFSHCLLKDALALPE